MQLEHCPNAHNSQFAPSRYHLQKNHQNVLLLPDWKDVLHPAKHKKNQSTCRRFFARISEKNVLFLLLSNNIIGFSVPSGLLVLLFEKTQFCRRMQNIEWKKSHIFFHLEANSKKFQNSMLPDAVLSHLWAFLGCSLSLEGLMIWTGCSGVHVELYLEKWEVSIAFDGIFLVFWRGYERNWKACFLFLWDGQVLSRCGTRRFVTGLWPSFDDYVWIPLFLGCFLVVFVALGMGLGFFTRFFIGRGESHLRFGCVHFGGFLLLFLFRAALLRRE